MHYELNILVAGGTASGKTAALNTLSAFIPSYHRVLSIEDVREIMLPKYMNWNWVPLTTRNANPEGLGEVSMLDLMYSSLRMRPDRIIVGEIRRQKEAEVLFEAMHTGHSVYATIHANNAKETIDRLTNPPINLPKNVLGALSLLLVQNRNRRTGKRRTLQIAEITDTGDATIIMQLDVHSDVLKKVGPMKRIRETLKLYTGLSDQEIDKDLAGKAEVIRWLVKNDINNVHDIGLVMAKYYIGDVNVKNLDQLHAVIKRVREAEKTAEKTG